MRDYDSINRAFRMSLLKTSAVAALFACGTDVAWAQEAPKTSTPTTASSGSSDSTSQSSNDVGEVVVTGTNIKGVKPIAPVTTITRQDIDESGYSTIGDVMRSLPEDFAGGQNPGTYAASGVNNENITDGSTVNLFGLGSDATLTLINGHRMPGDGFYSGSDVSVIPLGAIERIEVVTDGSSAIYGSDAVAGVVNFILRKDYSGLETSAYYGGATQGGDDDQTYSLLGGVVSDRWHALISAEYEHEDPVIASSRAFTSSAYSPTTLIDPQTRRTVFVSGGLNITDRISLSVDGLYSDRESGATSGEANTYEETERTYSRNFNVAATLDFRVIQDWDLSIAGTEAQSSNNQSVKEIYFGDLYPSATTYRNTVNSLEASANGTALTLPSGALRMAVGLGYRDESFSEVFPPVSTPYVQASRSVEYAYGEALIPLVRASVDRLGLQGLELSVSGRYERYSDFGDTENPRVGLRYTPIDGLRLLGSWGTSFKAPSFVQQYSEPIVIYYTSKDLGGQGPGNVLLTSGGNPDLKPERSTNWTIGAEYNPPKLRSMSVSITYFNIQYIDRIVEPLTPNYLSALSNIANAPFVNQDPSLAQIQSTVSSAGQFFDEVGTPYNPSTVVAIAQDNYENAVSQVDTGFNLSYRESFKLGLGNVRTFGNATWTHLTQQISKDAPVQTISGTIFNVPKFRARGGASWSNYGVTATAILNYTSRETNSVIAPSEKIASLTTMDAQVAYRFPDQVGFRHGLVFTLSATNLFDRAPPYANLNSAVAQGINFDSLNASVIGRFVAFKVAKKW